MRTIKAITRFPIRRRPGAALFRRAERRVWFIEPAWYPGESAAVATRPRFGLGAMGPLLAGQVLQQGETVVLIQKPSVWFVLIASLRVIALAVAAGVAARFWLAEHVSLRVIEIGLLVAAARVMAATLQWMGRLYILTDRRIIRLAGVLQPEIFDCPLRRVADMRLASRYSERLLRLGSVDIVAEESNAVGDWRAIKHPMRVLAKVRRMVEQAKQGGQCLRR